MLETTVRLRCDTCGDLFIETPWGDDQVRLLLLTAELAGWKVYRLAQDVYYGKAWCQDCRKDDAQAAGES